MTSTIEPKAPPRRVSSATPAEPITRLRATRRLLGQRLRLGIAVIIGSGVFAGAVSFLIPDVFVADASFFPAQQASSQSGLTSALGGMTMLIGALGGSAGGTQQPQFFMDLLKSRSFLDSMAVSTVVVDSLGTKRVIENFLVKKAKTPAERREKARSAIKSRLKVVQTMAGIIQVKVEAPTARAAASMADRAVVLIDQQNIDFRHRSAEERRAFNQEFAGDVRARLDSAEQRLEVFLQNNRSFQSSPVLAERYTSLYSEVTRLRMLEESVESQVENERLQEYNDAAVVTRVDYASIPISRTWPRRKLIVAGAMMFAALLMFWWAYWRVGRREAI